MFKNLCTVQQLGSLILGVIVIIHKCVIIFKLVFLCHILDIVIPSVLNLVELSLCFVYVLSPLGRGHSPMRSYDEPNKRLHMMDNVRDKVYPQDSFGGSHHDNYTRGGSDCFRSHDFGRNDDYLPGGHHDDYGRYNQQVLWDLIRLSENP